MKVFLRHIALLVGIAILAVLFYLGISVGVRRLLPQTSLVFGLRAPMTIQLWSERFADLPFWTLTVAVAAVAVWYLALLCRPVNRPGRAGARLFWLSLLFVAPAVSVWACYQLPPASYRTMLEARLFIVLYPVVFYYLATVLFSPPAYKYSPPGAGWLRRW